MHRTKDELAAVLKKMANFMPGAQDRLVEASPLVLGYAYSGWSNLSPLSNIISVHDWYRAGLNASSTVYCLEWRDELGMAKPFCVSSVWSSIRPRNDKVNWFDVVWFASCIPRHAFSIWLVVKQKLKTQDRVTWKSSKSVVTKLVIATTAYFIWQERNWRLFKNKKRSSKQVFDAIFIVVRLKLLSSRFKKSKDGVLFAQRWNLPISEYATEPLSIILQLEHENLVRLANVPILRGTRVSPPIAKESTVTPIYESLELYANVNFTASTVASEHNEEMVNTKVDGSDPKMTDDTAAVKSGHAFVQGISVALDDVAELVEVGSGRVPSGPDDVVVALSAHEKGDGLDSSSAAGEEAVVNPLGV
ncbi:ycf3-interacting protein 1, chloroplastic [Tanacetum coccineum]